MTWWTCRKQFSQPKPDEAYVGAQLGINPGEVSPRLHKLERAAGVKGRLVLICFDDGAVYVPPDYDDPIGRRLD